MMNTTSAGSTSGVAAAIADTVTLTWQEWKQRGNNFIDRKDFLAAANAYTEAIDAIESAEDNEDGRRNLHILYSNRSAAFASRAHGDGGEANMLSSTQDFRSAVADGRKCIELCHTFAKGYARIATGLQGLGDHAQAIEVLKIGLQVEPGSAIVKAALARAVRIREVAASGQGMFFINGGPPIEGTADNALLQLLQRYGTGTIRSARGFEAGTTVNLTCAGLYSQPDAYVDLPPYSLGTAGQVIVSGGDEAKQEVWDTLVAAVTSSDPRCCCAAVNLLSHGPLHSDYWPFHLFQGGIGAFATFSRTLPIWTSAHVCFAVANLVTSTQRVLRCCRKVELQHSALMLFKTVAIPAVGEPPVGAEGEGSFLKAAEDVIFKTFLMPTVQVVSNLVDQLAEAQRQPGGVGSFPCPEGGSSVSAFSRCVGPLLHAVFALADICLMRNIFEGEVEVPPSCGASGLICMCDPDVEISVDAGAVDDGPRGRKEDQEEVARLVREMLRLRAFVRAAEELEQGAI
jgi:hypothetical protein